MANELLGSVDWNEWRRVADGTAYTRDVLVKPVALVSAVVVDGKPHQVGEAERVALLVLALGRPRDKENKAIKKAIRTALRDIEQSVLQCEQEIDYES